MLKGFLCFVAFYFSWFSWRFLGRPFSDFGGQSVSNESLLGPLFTPKPCFCAVDFTWFFRMSRGSIFLVFGSQSTPNDGLLGTLLKTFRSKTGKMKPMVSCWPNHLFQGFEWLGLEILGNCFQLVFQTGSGGAILRLFVNCWVQPGPQRVTLGTISAIILRSLF